MINQKKKVIVAISGGVDSSVCAYLLKKKGYSVSGVFMENWKNNINDNNCINKNDLNDAKLICKYLQIKFYKVNFSFEYWNYVFKPFIYEYKKGKTPNPDILCNKKIKFKVFLDYAIKNLSADYIATGHYVRKKTIKNRQILLKGIDKKKDQSYFLYSLNQEQLRKCIFPIGNLRKIEVRDIARKIGLITSEKKDSTGICFIGKKNFQNFILKYINKNPGKIISTKGETIGKHDGLFLFTLGQRKGLKIGGIKNKKKLPWYVVKKDVKKNTLIVSQGKENSFLMSKGIIIKNLHLINPIKSFKSKKYTIKTRYLEKETPCKIFYFSNQKKLFVKFYQPIRAVTPGQSAVLYKGNICLGGGIIDLSI